MSTGIDANGRSFRWINGDKTECRHAVVGVPFDDNTGHIWSNAGAADPTKANKAISLESAWQSLDYIRPVSKNNSSDAVISPSTAADYIADAISQILPENELAAGIVLTIPNLLSEDGQFQLLEALKQRRLFNTRLLWRPVALALAWAGDTGENALASVTGALWVYDFESVNLEMTCLKWQVKSRNGDFICPVRDYPLERQWRDDFRSHDAVRALAESVVGRESAKSLLFGMNAGTFQRNIETGQSAEIVLYQDEHDPRRWKRFQRMPTLDCINLQWYEKEINAKAAEHPDDMLIVHGWPTRSMRFSSPNVFFMGADAVLQGTTIFTKRLANKQPTYFDTLPEYRIWAEYSTDNGSKDFDWFTVVKKDSVEADPEDVASRRSAPGVRRILDGMSISQHKNELRLFVQNKTRYDDEKSNRPEENIELARKLIQPLAATTRENIPVSFEITAKPARGHATVTAYVKSDQNRAIFTDGRPAEFSWKTATAEPEHKGYLEAQEVVGRIMDPVASDVAKSYGITDVKELARLLIRHLTTKLSKAELDRFQVAVNVYRLGNFNVRTGNHLKLLEWILERWGFAADQPMRGLFGSRTEHDPELLTIAQDITKYVRNTYSPNATSLIIVNAWWKLQSYLYLCSTDMYRADVRQFLLSSGVNASFSEIYAPGYVFSTAQDLELLIRFSLRSNANKGKQYWSFFRCLCWHQQTANADPDLVKQYLVHICDFFANTAGTLEERKYGLHAILFSLRLRSVREFLPKSDPLLQSLLQLTTTGPLHHINYPPSMISGMNNLGVGVGSFSEYVKRFLEFKDTLKDREIGAGLATSN